MSLQASLLIAEAKRRLRDPNARRAGDEVWLDSLNRVVRSIASRRKVAEFEAFGDLALDDRYPYPDDCVRLRWVRYGSDPSDLSTFNFVTEITNEDRWRDIIEGARVGTPSFYFARQGFFQIDTTPDTFVAQALWIAYWGIPEDITTPSTQKVALPDFFHDHVIDGMLIEARGILGAVEEANQERASWIEREMALGDIMQDRSEDERDEAMPESTYRGFSDQV